MYPFGYYNPGLLGLGLLLVLWTLPWKIYALWTAAKRGDKGWFVVILLLNTFAILELIYIFKVVKKTWAEVRGAFARAISGKK